MAKDKLLAPVLFAQDEIFFQKLLPYQDIGAVPRVMAAMQENVPQHFPSVQEADVSLLLRQVHSFSKQNNADHVAVAVVRQNDHEYDIAVEKIDAPDSDDFKLKQLEQHIAWMQAVAKMLETTGFEGSTLGVQAEVAKLSQLKMRLATLKTSVERLRQENSPANAVLVQGATRDVAAAMRALDPAKIPPTVRAGFAVRLENIVKLAQKPLNLKSVAQPIKQSIRVTLSSSVPVLPGLQVKSSPYGSVAKHGNLTLAVSRASQAAAPTASVTRPSVSIVGGRDHTEPLPVTGEAFRQKTTQAAARATTSTASTSPAVSATQIGTGNAKAQQLRQSPVAAMTTERTSGIETAPASQQKISIPEITLPQRLLETAVSSREIAIAVVANSKNDGVSTNNNANGYSAASQSPRSETLSAATAEMQVGSKADRTQAVTLSDTTAAKPGAELTHNKTAPEIRAQELLPASRTSVVSIQKIQPDRTVTEPAQQAGRQPMTSFPIKENMVVEASAVTPRTPDGQTLLIDNKNKQPGLSGPGIQQSAPPMSIEKKMVGGSGPTASQHTDPKQSPASGHKKIVTDVTIQKSQTLSEKIDAINSDMARLIKDNPTGFYNDPRFISLQGKLDDITKNAKPGELVGPCGGKKCPCGGCGPLDKGSHSTVKLTKRHDASALAQTSIIPLSSRSPK